MSFSHEEGVTLRETAGLATANWLLIQHAIKTCFLMRYLCVDYENQGMSAFEEFNPL